jgi:hypothetical protein
VIVNFQKKIDFNSPIDCLFDSDDLRRAIIWYSNKPVCRLKHIYLYGRYYAVSIYEHKIHIHRLLMMYWLKRDLASNEYVHHKNGNRFDNRKENLEIVFSSVHQSMTNKGRKQTQEHINRRADATTKTRYGHSIYENPELLEEAK